MKIVVPVLWLIFCFSLVAVLTLLICGCTASTKVGEAANVDRSQVGEFDRQLSEINDQPSAEKAVNTFVDYVDSRLDKTTGNPKSQSVRALVTTNLISEIARQELLARQGKMIMISSSSGEGEEMIKPLIDTGTLTDTLNKLGEDQGLRVDDETVNLAKSLTEASLPSLNPEKSTAAGIDAELADRSGMTPLESMVVGYAIISEDDGSAPPGSVKASAEDISSFMETVTQ